MAKKLIEESEKKYRALSANLEDQVKKRTTDLARRNDQLATLNKELELFAHISSHDLQEPLRKAKMAFSRISNDDLNALTEKGKGHIQKANIALDAMQVLIDDLQIYWRSDQSNKVFEYTDMDLLVAEVKEGLSLQIEEKNATIKSSPLGHCSVVRFQFRQLLHNLLSNALKFSKPGIPPTIEVKSRIINAQELDVPNLSNCTKYYNLSISDNGIGFDKKYNEKIFEVFQRLHGKDLYKGTGIGLAIVKKIIDHHHGFIKASSENSTGATFNMYIPFK